MQAKNSLNNQTMGAVGIRVITDSVVSKDGTTIGYRQLGHGPAVILVHGSMSSGYNHLQLAEALADVFTVYLPDRRGRGLSGPYGKNDTLQQEVEDLDALLTKTGAHAVFGLSSGAIICLQAALTLPAIHKAAIFEPPIFMDKQGQVAALTRFDREMAQGKVAAALITGMKAAQMGPPIFNLIPRLLLERLTGAALKQEKQKGGGEYPPMSVLAATLHYDFLHVAEVSGQVERFRAISTEVLLLGGSKSPAYLKTALDALARVLPRARRIEFPGLGHDASWNAEKGGHPQSVAQELRTFFA